FYECFRSLYRQNFGNPERWLTELSQVLNLQHAEGFSAERACLAALLKLKIPRADFTQYIQESLLSLRGWAGMFRQLEERPDKAPLERIPARLVDYLAVSLTLEAEAATYLHREHRSGGSTRELNAVIADDGRA